MIKDREKKLCTNVGISCPEDVKIKLNISEQKIPVLIYINALG